MSGICGHGCSKLRGYSCGNSVCETELKDMKKVKFKKKTKKWFKNEVVTLSDAEADLAIKNKEASLVKLPVETASE